MKQANFRDIQRGQGRIDAVSAGVCLVDFKGRDRKVEDQCLLINVTGLSEPAIKDLAGVCVKLIKAAKGE